MTLKLSQLRAKLESGIKFYDGVFFLEFVEHINFTVSRSGAPRLRITPHNTGTTCRPSQTSGTAAPAAPSTAAVHRGGQGKVLLASRLLPGQAALHRR